MNRSNNNTPATFKAGDAVLCPSIGNSSYTLYPNGSDKDSTRLIIRSGDDSHGFYRDGRVFPNDALPSLFLDTEANRQAIATLYSGNQSSQRTFIDTTAPDDDEVILISSHDLSDITCDMQGAATVLDDIGQLLWLVYSGKIEASTATSMARITHDSTNAWAELLLSKIAEINKSLAMTSYGKEGK